MKLSRGRVRATPRLLKGLILNFSSLFSGKVAGGAADPVKTGSIGLRSTSGTQRSGPRRKSRSRLQERSGCEFHLGARAARSSGWPAKADPVKVDRQGMRTLKSSCVRRANSAGKDAISNL